MKHLVWVFLGLIFVAKLSAGDVAGKLSFEGDQVVFRAPGVEQSYKPDKVPGLKLINYVPKMTMQSGKEVDMSELTYAPPNGGTFMLIKNQSVDVIKNDAQTGTIWKLAPSQ